MADIDSWVEAQEFQITLDANGRIIDYLDNNIKRPNTPEERIRQKMVQILHCEFAYPMSHIGIEKQINIGREIKRADIVIYNSAAACASNDQGNIYLIAECKAPNILNSDGQLYSYMSASSAQGGFWTNGNKIEFYRKDVTTGAFISWIGLPKYEQAWDSIGKYKKSDLIIPVDLKLAFRRCHNAIYRSGIDSEDIALDMVRIILSKIEDESSANEECDFHITPEEFKDEHSRDAACSRVRKLFYAVRDRYKDVFSANEDITASNGQLAVVISQLQQYAFMDSPHDVIGTAYEIYVASHLKGERGQYFTNRLVVNMMVKMAAPTEKDIILDPACGSGGFILAAMNYIFDNIDASRRSATAKEILKRNVVHQLFGVDKNIRRYFTGTALTQLNSDNVKYLDSSKANAQVKKHLDALTIHKGYILVSDSGTLGRVTYALEQHDGHVATNNLIRIIVDDIPLRGYLYEFLQSELGQSLMLKNAYGTNQEHLEPDIIADIPIPIPKDKTVIQKIGNAVTESIEQLEKSISAGNIAKTTLNEILE